MEDVVQDVQFQYPSNSTDKGKTNKKVEWDQIRRKKVKIRFTCKKNSQEMCWVKWSIWVLSQSKQGTRLTCCNKRKKTDKNSNESGSPLSITKSEGKGKRKKEWLSSSVLSEIF